MTQFVEQLRNQAKWYAQPGHNARDLMDSRLLEKAADEIECLRAKVEAAEKSDAESLAMYRRARDERDALRAKISEMERQEPIGEMLEVSPHNYELRWYRPVPFGAKLYTRPGAKGEEK